MRFGFFKKIVQKVDQIVTGRGRVDEDLFEELEALMIQGDINVHTTQKALQALRVAVQEERMASSQEVLGRLKGSLTEALVKGGDGVGNALKVSPVPPTLYLIVGVNGVGKTTTIAK